jgi:hypothetical protein
MTPDESYAVLVLTGLLVIIMQKQVSSVLLELLLKLTRPGATIFLLGLTAYTFHRGLHYTFLIMAVVSVVLLRDIWVQWVQSDAKRVFLEVGRDNARFDHATSIDLQFADGTVTHASPSLYFKPSFPTLLVFPPSPETLHEMNG